MFEFRRPLHSISHVYLFAVLWVTMPSYRSQSRSPAIGSSLLATLSNPSSSRTPTFQPPSYYAAAAGLPSHTTSRQRCKSNEDSRSRNTASTYGIPLSYPTQHVDGQDLNGGVSNTNSSHDNGTARNRSSSLSLTRSLSRGKSNRNDKDQNDGKNERTRTSQFMDIPMLEAQLLPSLRDTIDRMTHPQIRRSKTLDDESCVARSQSKSGQAMAAQSATAPSYNDRSEYASSRDTKSGSARIKHPPLEVQHASGHRYHSAQTNSPELNHGSLRTPRVSHTTSAGNSPRMLRYMDPEEGDPSVSRTHSISSGRKVTKRDQGFSYRLSTSTTSFTNARSAFRHA